MQAVPHTSTQASVDSAAPGPSLAVVLKGYPRLSETFIAQELLALQRRGFRLRLISLRHPTDAKRHPVHDEITAPVTYLPEYLYQEPWRVLRAWRRARHLPGYRRARQVFLKDLWRDRTPNRIRRFGQACALAAELPDDVERLYAHFLHTPASVARYAAVMRGLPWCGSAHAKDIWTLPDWEKREKLAEADWLVTCTAYGAEHLRALAPEPQRVGLVYHGLDLSRFAAASDSGETPENRDGSAETAPVRLLSVGRLVEKKGYDDLLAALAALPAGRHWHLTHIGGGPLAQPLRQQAEKLGLAGRISWLGPQAQREILAHYRKADIFVLASRIARTGDRDGLPNVLMEAQSQGLTCLATAAAAIPELIEDGITGCLVPPGDPETLARALSLLMASPDLRAQLGRAGEVRVRRDFDMNRGIDALDRLLRSGQASKLAELL
ncbi:glycosyltransferase family 4 protein [Pelagibius litoralis]|uniref:Glycosyltransferase family 4 protein n=1 Tax=Pelagibius litoralis TaxID=374515 RepID=A0A967F263_9PROT|nr:glycosyltransferase [Pelagibius litoralis]NIA71663.1 glycosyltransferase family 4 protein [Pelagibius litoralis]